VPVATKSTAIAMAAAGAILAAASIAQAFGEVVPYFASGVGDRQKFEAIITGAFEPAASKWSRDLYLDDCMEVPRSFFALAQPAAMRDRMLAACNANARQIVQSTPNASNAWVVLAATSAELNDFATMRTALGMSKRTGPNLQWLADRRTRVAEAYAAELDDAGRADYESDIAVLASSNLGRALLAQRYARNDDLRETYIRVLDAAPADQKRSFLSAVRKELAS
jgi:hypothetical protein